MSKRMTEALIGGPLLGIVCVVGASIRSGFTADPSSYLPCGSIASSLVWSLVLLGRIPIKPMH